MKISPAYLAGLIDGEGSISLQKQIPRSGKMWLTGTITIANTYYPVLVLIKHQYGGNLGGLNIVDPRHRECFVWCVTSRDNALNILDVVQPYLIIKADHARVLRKFLESRKKIHSTIGSDKAYTRSEILCFEKLKALNGRGANSHSSRTFRPKHLQTRACKRSAL